MKKGGNSGSPRLVRHWTNVASREEKKREREGGEKRNLLNSLPQAHAHLHAILQRGRGEKKKLESTVTQAVALNNIRDENGVTWGIKRKKKRGGGDIGHHNCNAISSSLSLGGKRMGKRQC